MSKVQKVTEFVEGVFDLYRMNKGGVFFTYDCDTPEEVPVPLFPDGKIDDESIRKISSYIGLTKEEIVGMKLSGMKKYWEKYPFFSLYQKYLDAWSWHQNYAEDQPSEADRLLNILSFDGRKMVGTPRYDMDDLRARLIRTLKEVDQVIPGTYHEEAEITKLRIETQVFFSFPQCAEMLRSFIDMVKRMEELFFGAMHGELNEDDANELNFLATWLEASDAMMPSVTMNYDNVRTYRKAYLEENSTDFFYYVRLRSFVHTDPWRCQEFFDDMDLVREFLYIFPRAKAEMRKFAHDVTKFACAFIWSDARPVRFSNLDEYILEVENGGEPLRDEDRARESTLVYVDKRPEEMPGWDAQIQRLKEAAGPVAKGGIPVPVRPLPRDDPNEMLRRLNRRLDAKHGGAANG